MKNHKRFEELIQGYLDNALDSKERRDLEKHLKSCEKCREELKRKETLLQKLRLTKEEIRCPDYLIDNILKNTTQKEAPVIISSSKIRWKYLAVSAAAVLIIVSTVLINIEYDNSNLITKRPREMQKIENLDKIEVLKSAEKFLDEEKVKEVSDGRPVAESRLEEAKVPRTPLPVAKKDFVEREKVQKSSKELAAPKGKITMDFSQIEETYSLESYDSKTERSFSEVSESALAGGIISQEDFKETRFVFPEEGSVVGEDFEIVLILEDPDEAIEISLDGEKIANYTKDKDSNVIFIGSDSIPPLEEGLHYLSLSAKGEKNITFYKEG
jgi:hypothetical protein